MYKKAIVSLVITISLITFGNTIAQELTQDTTWSGTQVVEDIVTVPAGIVLNIEPGTTVRMEEDTALVIYGKLLADGTEAEPIHFTRNDENDEWERIMFIEAQDSLLRHCIIEYADCEGRHQDYYEAGPRDYHEAVVILASHVDIENCTFQNLPDDSSNAEGDAIVVISDDEDHPGEASANIKGCQFLAIGQGVHTRFSYILVENCFFTDKNGDNDDVDLWGESTPPPMIRNNVFLNPDHDDMINPTKCSAIIIGNIIAGSDDHGVVLRDRCFPVMMNNIIYDCANAGIAIENTCEALLINNTIVDCGRGLRLLDLGRAGPPYYLTPGGGNATVINCIIWDCPQPVTLADSSNTDAEDRGSHITISYSDIEGGPDGVSNSGTYSTLTWGVGNIDVDPQFADEDNRDFHLKSEAGRWDTDSENWIRDDITSPCIDTGDPNTPVAFEPFPNGAVINMGAYGGLAEASKSPSGLHAKYGGGTGDPNNPYLIYTAEQMNTIGAEPNDWDKYFKLMANVDLSEYSYDRALIAPDVNAAEIGFQGTPFTGVFNGNNHTISNFTCIVDINEPPEEDGFFGYGKVGLFGFVTGPQAQIKNLSLIDPNIYPAANCTERVGDVGAIVGGLSLGSITNCYVKGGQISADSSVGGLVGSNDGTISNCYTTCDVTWAQGRSLRPLEQFGATSHSFGGLVGFNRGWIYNCHATGSVQGTLWSGGLVGSNESDVFNKELEIGVISDSYATGNVNGDESVGGLVGGSSGTISSCYALGKVSGLNDVGGLAGFNIGLARDSYATGEISGDTYIGGLIGLNYGSVTYCYSTGMVIGENMLGGLLGDNEGNTVISSFWDIETSGLVRSAGGDGKSTAEMQTAGTFLDAGWDFVDERGNGTEDIWWILDGQDYPRLWWEQISEN